jgi:hypothetical protein
MAVLSVPVVILASEFAPRAMLSFGSAAGAPRRFCQTKLVLQTTMLFLRIEIWSAL